MLASGSSLSGGIKTPFLWYEHRYATYRLVLLRLPVWSFDGGSWIALPYNSDADAAYDFLVLLFDFDLCCKM